jgi:hypothetical protein
LANVVPRVGTKFVYDYGFGDDWLHELLLEAILLPEPRVFYSRYTGGERRASPEDTGGPWVYPGYLEARSNAKHPKYVLRQSHGRFDPEAFSLDVVNRNLRKQFRRPRTDSAAG